MKCCANHLLKLTPPLISRRQMLARAGFGFGAWALLPSAYHDALNHAPAQYMMNTGSARMGRPCIGSWVSYGLGSESENLPAFVVMADTGDVKGGPPVFGRGFLPGTYQPTVLRNAGSPVLYLDPPADRGAADQRE